MITLKGIGLWLTCCCACAWLVVVGSPRAAQAQQAPAATQQAPTRLSFAVVIGNNKSLGKRRPELRYADDDAARYYEILATIAPGRVSLLTELDRDTERLFPVTSLRATRPSLNSLTAVGQRLADEVLAANAAGHETEVYFIFAGHGDVAEGEGYIELADARFRARDLTAWLRRIPFTRAHVILDSCNSFFMLGVRKPGGRHFATSEDAARSLATGLSNVGVFLSTSADGEAFEWSEIQSGIFSHVVRSGLLGGADANGDGAVSYLELAAFVATATADVKNPNMRPHVYARGPGAKDSVAIASLQSMSSVRRFELSDAGALRVRLRDANGVPLLDAHSERSRPLLLALPEAWARGSVLERASISGSVPQAATAGASPERYGVPDLPGAVTLAALQTVEAKTLARGPDETFRLLFSQPFGPQALAQYQATQARLPPAVYGVSTEDTRRMELLLDQFASAARGQRISESIGGLGAGLLLGGAGIGLLDVDDDMSTSEKTEARVLGGTLLGLGSLFTIGSGVSLAVPTKAERAAGDFRQSIRAGEDATQAFARADDVIRQLAETRRQERMAQGIIGGIVIVGCATGLVLAELAADGEGDRMGSRLGWSAGMLGGAVMLGDAVLMDHPADNLTRIWQQDPTLNQYQKYRTSLRLKGNGAFLSLSGEL
ncbi:MAG TPA: hypothetical protein VIW29_04305 [Polyangiaceae bacterium]